MDELKTLEAMGLTMPTPAYFAGVLLFSIIGYAAYRIGKKSSVPSTKWIGIALMLYPYVVAETWVMYVVGVGLCGAAYVLHKK